jgi:adenosylcobyric acid synthase
MAAAVMVVGTASHVGKSLVATALCRLLAEDGYRVAPFKSQNMSLNATVTPDGREIAWSQALQAEAAGIAPTADMNPVLLKPSGPTRSQVVLQGRVLGEVEARDYFFDGKARLWAAIRDSYARLAEAFDVIVIEGAGSPVEMNLKPWDLANLRVAEMADAKVLLVADIERGGVFAAVVGTVALLEPAERQRLAGVIVNKFRGDVGLFAEGREWLEQRTGIPVWGVLPYLEHLDLEEEDTLGLEGARYHEAAHLRPAAALSVVGIRLPHVANFMDLDPLVRDPRLRVQWLTRPEEMGQPDLLVLPGSKNTMDDAAWLHDTGWDDAIRRAHARGTHILGLCGGYQLLGREIRDPHHVESMAARRPGVGLLAQVTTLTREKTTVRALMTLAAPFPPATVAGYELHMGVTESVTPYPPLGHVGNRPEGVVADGGRIVGTYLHGLLDNPPFTEAWLARVATAHGKTWPKPKPALLIAGWQRREEAYRRLARAFRDAVGPERLYGLWPSLPETRRP